MKKDIIVMLPTVYRAVNEWEAFIKEHSKIIKKVNKISLCIELLSGHKIYFKGETEGKRVLLGLNADFISVDELHKKFENKCIKLESEG